MQLAFLHKGTKSIVTVSLSPETTIEQAKTAGVLPQNQPLLELDETKPLCDDDPSMTLFHCWTFDNPTVPSKIVVDMEKAKAYWIEYLRTARNTRLKAIDSLQLRALGMNNTTEFKRLEQIKQQLRDLPKQINLDNVTTVKQLLDYRPTVLYAE